MRLKPIKKTITCGFLLGQLLACSASNSQPASSPEAKASPTVVKRPYAERIRAQFVPKTFKLALPNERGQIVAGYYKDNEFVRDVLAGSRKGYYVQINFESYMGRLKQVFAECDQLRPPNKNCVANRINDYIQANVQWINESLGRKEVVQEFDALTYFENRRWIPMRIGSMLSDSEYRKLCGKTLAEGVELLEVPLRFYPRKGLAGHLLGAVRRSSDWPKGPIQDGEVLYPPMNGIKGIEKTQDFNLNGVSTVYQHRFDENGKEILPRIVSELGSPGREVLLTLDVKMQELAERLLVENTKRGAFVVLEISTMEIKALASRPTIDPNDYVPVLTVEKENEWKNDTANKPLQSRAYEMTYPPASVFKLATALMGLESGIVQEGETRYQCKKFEEYAGLKMKNWDQAATSEPYLNVISAIMRSCNTWFFQMANDLYSRPLFADKDFKKMFFKITAELGLGRRTGLEVSDAEQGAGYMYVKDGVQQAIHAGADVANISIGQADLAVTPLQMAQMIARIATPDTNSAAHVIATRQAAVGESGTLVAVKIDSFSSLPLAYAFNRFGMKVLMPLYERSLQWVRAGMYNVVNNDSGTAGAASSRDQQFSIAGKTGSAQWAGDKNVAWFASYAPYYDGTEARHNQPKYAVVAMKEGRGGEELSGGRSAAPMVGQFYNSDYVASRIDFLPVVKAEPVRPPQSTLPEAVPLRAIPVYPRAIPVTPTE